MALGKPFPQYSQAPEVRHLPDGRRAYTRYREIAAASQITDDLLAQLALGALDPQPLFTSATYGPYLIQREIAPGGADGKTYEALHFEEIKGTGETQIGGNTKIKLEDGRTALEARFLQLTATTATPGTPGTSTAPGDTSAYLKDEKAENDGTVRRITRTYVYAGTIATDLQTLNGGALLKQTITSVKTEPSTPSGYTPIGQPVQNPNGLPVYTYTYAKGDGTVDTQVSTRSDGNLIIYAITALGSAPSAPSATIGGTVTLFDTDVRHADGYDIYNYRWFEAKPDGRTGLQVTARPDGSLVYNVTELGAAVDTPTYPGSGTAYLVDLDNNAASDGYYVNRATYIKPPASVTLTKMRQVNLPGLLTFETLGGAAGHNLLITAESSRYLKCSLVIDYNTSQLTDTVWKVDYGTTYRASYTRTGQTTAEYELQSMRNYLATSASVSGTSKLYNGVACDSYAASITSSSPTALPSGATVLDIDHDVYLTAIDGTVVYRRFKVSFTFP